MPGPSSATRIVIIDEGLGTRLSPLPSQDRGEQQERPRPRPAPEGRDDDACPRACGHEALAGEVRGSLTQGGLVAEDWGISTELPRMKTTCASRTGRQYQRDVDAMHEVGC